jgi:hypothetical protein
MKVVLTIQLIGLQSPYIVGAGLLLSSRLTAQQLPFVLTERQLDAQQRCQNG